MTWVLLFYWYKQAQTFAGAWSVEASNHAIARVHWQLQGSHVGMVLLQLLVLHRVKGHAEAAMPKVLPIDLQPCTVNQTHSGPCTVHWAYAETPQCTAKQDALQRRKKGGMQQRA